MTINQPCWMMTEAPSVVQCRLIYISDNTHAIVLVPDAIKKSRPNQLRRTSNG